MGRTLGSGVRGDWHGLAWVPCVAGRDALDGEVQGVIRQDQDAREALDMGGVSLPLISFCTALLC